MIDGRVQVWARQTCLSRSWLDGKVELGSEIHVERWFGCFEEEHNGSVRIVDQERCCFLIRCLLRLIPHPSLGFCFGNSALLWGGSAQATWFRVRRNCPPAL